MRQRISFLEGREAIETPYKKGDFIGTKYEVHGAFTGGFGVVYLAYDHYNKAVLALKTFRDKYLRDDGIRELFRKEADTWVRLERHPYLVRAYVVDEISGRLYIVMEYIAAPDEEGHLNSLAGYLEWSPPDLVQSLCWAIQFCHGMEYAYSPGNNKKGILCHRDIKPGNIMISYDKTVKISDLGLAAVVKETGVICGTPGYRAPEVERGEGADVRSDIYSFGIVLWQMAAGSADPPQRGWLGGIPSVDGPMQAVIKPCLQEKPDRRYPTFEALRKDLERLLKKETGEVIKLPDKKEFEAWELSNKGFSLYRLGRFDEAIPVYNKAIEINPRLAEAYNNRGVAYAEGKGKYDLAISDYNMALEINPRYAEAYNNRGSAYVKKGDYDRAISDYNKALEINPRYTKAYNNRGVAYAEGKGKYDLTISDYNMALEINPRYAEAYNNRGLAYDKKGDYDRAIADYNKALELNPRSAEAYSNRGLAYNNKGEYDRAIADYNKATEINPREALVYSNRGLAYKKKGDYDRAIADFNKALEINPRCAKAYAGRGLAYDNKGEYDRAIGDYNKALELNPRLAEAYLGRAVAYYAKGEYDRAWEDVYKAQGLGCQVRPELLEFFRQATGR